MDEHGKTRLLSPLKDDAAFLTVTLLSAFSSTYMEKTDDVEKSTINDKIYSCKTKDWKNECPIITSLIDGVLAVGIIEVVIILVIFAIILVLLLFGAIAIFFVFIASKCLDVVVQRRKMQIDR